VTLLIGPAELLSGYSPRHFPRDSVFKVESPVASDVKAAAIGPSSTSDKDKE
jgi:hypothetical protein